MTNYGACTQERRIARVMFVYGFTRAEALIFLRGWTKGRRAALVAYKRDGVRQDRPRVGGPAWEAQEETP